MMAAQVREVGGDVRSSWILDYFLFIGQTGFAMGWVPVNSFCVTNQIKLSSF